MSRQTKDNQKITFEVPEGQKPELERRARDLDLTLSQLLRRLTKQFLNGQSSQNQPANRAGGSGEQHKRAA